MSKGILTLFIALTVFTMSLAFLQRVLKDKLLIANRFQKIMSNNQTSGTFKKKPKEKKGKNKKKTLKVFTKMENEIISAGLLIRPSEFLIIWCSAALAPALILLFLTDSITAAVAALLIGVILPPLVVHMKKMKRLELFEKQLVEAIAIICNSLRSGLTLQQAMLSIAQEMPEPISKEFGRVTREINLGSNLEKALSKMAERLNSKSFMMIVSAILIQRQTGGNLSDILSNIADTIKERFNLKSEIKVLTATARSSGIIVGLLPVCMLLLFSMINPVYIESFFYTSAGVAMLITAAVLETIGFLIIKKIVTIKY
ncbi:MAG: type II secretion system F family protein [Clostridia bacterium]|nr:type II secretion system F family protein [Clostridia bacterium]